MAETCPTCGATLGRRPLVITGVGGGLVQWQITRRGTGEPRTHVLDYDREGQGGDELRDFAEEIRQARNDLAEFGGAEAADQIAEFNRQIAEYNGLADRGETASRYR